MGERDGQDARGRAEGGAGQGPSAVPLTPGSAPFRNQLALPEAAPGFGDEMRREVQASAMKRLEALDRVYQQLQAEARGVVGAARRDMALHAVPLNGTKLRGRDYHLFARPSGERFFSLLEAADYRGIDPAIRFVASYRLNHDGSWTRLDADDEADKLAHAPPGGAPVTPDLDDGAPRP